MLNTHVLPTLGAKTSDFDICRKNAPGVTNDSLRAFIERVFANLRNNIAGKQVICGCQKTYTNTGTFPQTPIFSWLALCYVSLYEISPKVDSAEAV